MGERRISYETADGFRLVGLLASPPKTTRWAVMLHGITESKDEYGGFYKDLAEALNSKGVGTLRLDFRGHGESSGSSMDISVLGDVLDIDASVIQLPQEGSAPMALIATSFGAGPAILAASTRRWNVRCLALIAPVLDYSRTFLVPETPWSEEWFGPRAEESAAKRGYFNLEEFKLSPKLLEEFRFIRPLEFLRESKIPTLILHGDKDTMVPYSVSADSVARSYSVTLHTLRDADHGYSHFEDETGLNPLSLSLKRELVEEAARYVDSRL